MIYVWAYLLVGSLNYSFWVARGNVSLSPRPNTFILVKGGGRRPSSRRDHIPEVLVEAAFFVLLWPFQVIFRLVYVPIHDFFAGRAWRRARQNGELPWLD